MFPTRQVHTPSLGRDFLLDIALLDEGIAARTWLPPFGMPIADDGGGKLGPS